MDEFDREFLMDEDEEAVPTDEELEDEDELDDEGTDLGTDETDSF